MAADDAGTDVARLQAELYQLRAQLAAAQTEVEGLYAENRALASAYGAAREQQAATAEILRIVASSRFDLTGVLNELAERAYRVCGASSARIYLVDGELLRVVSATADSEEELARFASYGLTDYTVAISPSSMVGRAVIERRAIHIEDAHAEDVRVTYTLALTDETTPRSRLHVPLQRDGVAVGVLAVSRREQRPFTEQEIGLIQTFADQAVIAIENTRLFEDLGQRTSELTQALERQTALAEVLRVIASSPADLQQMLDA